MNWAQFLNSILENKYINVNLPWRRQYLCLLLAMVFRDTATGMLWHVADLLC